MTRENTGLPTLTYVHTGTRERQYTKGINLLCLNKKTGERSQLSTGFM